MISGEFSHLTDLLDRTLRAEKAIARLARDSAVAKSEYAKTERQRLEGKAEGVRLVASYVREAMRDAEQAEEAS